MLLLKFKQVLAGNQMDSTRGLEESQGDSCKVLPAAPEVTANLIKRDLSLQVGERMQSYCWLETSITKGGHVSSGLYGESYGGCAESNRPISPGMSPGIQELAREQK